MSAQDPVYPRDGEDPLNPPDPAEEEEEEEEEDEFDQEALQAQEDMLGDDVYGK